MQVTRFISSESGAVTTEYMAVTGLVVGMALSIGLAMGNATMSVADEVGDEVASVEMPAMPVAAQRTTETNCRAERAPSVDGPAAGGTSVGIC